MKLSPVLALAVIVLLWSVSAMGESLPLTPGYYEVKATMSVSDKPESRNRCVTVEHLTNPEAVLNYAFSQKFRPLPDHKVINFTLQGDKISYDVDTPFSVIRVEGRISSTEFSVVRSNTSKSGKVSPVPLTLKTD
jgi:hypothetical protein